MAMKELTFVTSYIDEKQELLIDIADCIWSLAELPYAETESAEVLCRALEKDGFALRAGWRRCRRLF